jgi:hypothetical protein
MKVSFTGPQMGRSVTVYLTDPAFGGETSFEFGAELDTAVITPETKKKVAELVRDGFAVQVKTAKKGDE